jgi:iron complex outermembrane receptor protein
MSFKRNKLRDAIAFALVVGAAGAFGTGAAFAQETPAAEDTAELETITVTGTRIQSQTVTASSPVVEIQPEEFQYSGATRVDDLVNQYPQMSPYFDSFANNPSTGYPTIDLRGLGPQRTLTLVNGNRLAPGALEVRDISMIPASLVKRVDILTGGASAVYGSDAIAGVVNFILNTEFEGVSVSAGINAYQHKNDNDYMQGLMDLRGFDYPTGNSGFDGVSKNIDIAIGSSFADGAGHAMAWLTWRQNDALFQGERDYSSCALNAAGTACGGSATNAAGNFYIYQILPDGPDAGTAPDIHGESASLNPDGSWNDAYGAPYNYAPINYYQRPDERYTFGASLKYEINEHFRPYLETMFVHKRDALQIAESGAFFTFINGTCDNPLFGTMCADLGFDPTRELGIYVAKRNVEGGPRHQATENNSYRFVAGVEGAINDSWSYNTSFLYGHTQQETQGFNDFLTDRIAQALLGCPEGSFDGCLLYNVWEPGGVTPEAANALAGVAFFATTAELKSFNAYVTGDLGWGFPMADGENVSIVFGGEWREESYDFNADSHSQAGNFAGSGGPSLPVGGTISVAEMFMEAAIPVYKGDGLLRSFAFDLGYRLSDYNLSGQANTYKLGFAADFGMIRARGGFNHAIRAPGTNELFATQQIALFGGADPCAGATPVFTEAQCANTGVLPGQYGTIAQNPAQQNNQFIGGNPNLQPESADTWTLGFVATPIDGLQLSLDYYDIKLEETIDTIGASTILEFCALTGDPFLCDRINRNALTGDLWRGSDPATAGHVVNLTDNFGEQHFRGIDLGASYRWEMLGGRFGASFQGTHLLEQEYNPLPGVNEDAIYDCVGRINASCQQPQWRHIASVRYSRDWFTVQLRWRYMGEMDYEDNDGNPLFTDRLLCDADEAGAPANCMGDGTLEAYNYIDLSGSAFIGKNTEITMGVNNIADKEPPLVGVNEALNANSPGGYDQAGRYFFASVTFKW